MKIQTSHLTQWGWQWLLGVLCWDGVSESWVELMGKSVVVNYEILQGQGRRKSLLFFSALPIPPLAPPASGSFTISWFLCHICVGKNDSGLPYPINVSIKYLCSSQGFPTPDPHIPFQSLFQFLMFLSSLLFLSLPIPLESHTPFNIYLLCYVLW